MDTLNRSIFITFQFVGFHRWTEAPEEVDYLRARHRHLFKVRVDVSVGHDDRQIEYHIFKRAVLSEMSQLTGFSDESGNDELELGSSSCEAIATWILGIVRGLYPSCAAYSVEVSEDGENGSTVVA